MDDTTSAIELAFGPLPAAQDAIAAGELHLRPRGTDPSLGRKLALLALDEGPAAFCQGTGKVKRLVLQQDPTLDDLLAAGLLQRMLRGEAVNQEALRAFANYAAQVREGLKGADLPLADSLEGIYLAVRREGGADLSDAVSRGRFLKQWSRLEQRIWQAAERGVNPFTTSFLAGDPEFARARAYLTGDRDVYLQQDVPRGESWLLRIPDGPAQDVTGLLLRRPRSTLWKYWSRDASAASGGKGYLFLAVSDDDHHWRFSTDPVLRVSIQSLADVLQKEEAAVDPGRAESDPWYDGRRHEFTLVAAPLAGTRLSDAQVLSIVKQWGQVRVASATRCPEDDELICLLDQDADDPPAPELKMHVEGCDYCQRRLGQLDKDLRTAEAAITTVAGTARPVAVAQAGQGTEAAPSRIGKYYVLGPLGRGGQADVFRALHPTLGKELAIKLARAPLRISAGDQDRLKEEARLLQELNHPNLGTGLVDLDVTEDGRPFLVMEYVRGPSLVQHVGKAQRLAPHDAVRLLIPLARGLAAAHRRGIRHLDVKPSNILIDEHGRPRLIDFGIASLHDVWEAPGQVAGGTPEFMAPEQVEGDPAQVDGRADVYGLGGVLYYLLVGQPPRSDADRSNLMERAQRGDVDLAALERCGAPRRLRDVCRRALAPLSTDRFVTADAFADALERSERSLIPVAILGAAAVLAAIGVIWLIVRSL